MLIKLLQLNMQGGRQFSNIKKFLQENQFDILCFQEVMGVSPEHASKRDTADCFEDLQRILGNTHHGKLTIHSTFTPGSFYTYQGNAIFYRKEFILEKEDILWLYKRTDPFPGNATSFEEIGRNALHLTIQIDGKPYDILTAHLAWAPTPIEQSHERVQNVKFVEYVSKLNHPFILTGDFNLQPDQLSILDLEKYGRDLTKEYAISNTLNERLHRAWDKIKPGFSVDYIFVSPEINVNDFNVLSTLDLSDHYGLTARVTV